MSYVYYPGCSLQASGRAYDESLQAVFSRLGVGLPEIEDWNCCGATAYMAISELKAFALCARNFALARRQTPEDACPAQIVAPCAACYLGLNKAARYLNDYPWLRKKVAGALEAAGLLYTDQVRVRHPLDVLANDIGLDAVAAQVRQPLNGLRVACYYGCQIVRPYADFDHQQAPVSMDRLMAALGAEVIDWPLKTRCCGGALTGTVPDAGQGLSHLLLKEARRRNCDLIVTACPLCQFNLECYQQQMGRRLGEPVRLTVAYFTQALGMALGLTPRRLGLGRLFVPWPHAPQAQTRPAAGGQEGGRHAQE